MNWDEFIRYRQHLGKGALTACAGPLGMIGVQFDNRYTDSVRALTSPNTLDVCSTYADVDFVWFRDGEIKHYDPDGAPGFGTAGCGHPALAGFAVPYCAGEIHADGISFKSGHFRPPQKNGVAFICDMIMTSCAGLTGDERDAMVDRIASLPLTFFIWVDDAGIPYPGTLNDIVHAEMGHGATMQAHSGASAGSDSSSSSSAVASASAVAGTSASAHAPAPARMHRNRPPPLDTASVSRAIDARASPASSMQRSPSFSSPGGATGNGQAPKKWQPNTTGCTLCHRPFTLFTRPHHCRRCGQVVCDDCSRSRKYVKWPANEKNAQVPGQKGDLHRVCNACVCLKDAVA